MSGFDSKAKMAYFKDNVQKPDEQDDFSMQQYYYSRDGAAGSSNSVDQGYPPSSSSYGLGGVSPHMTQPMGIVRQQSTPTGQNDAYPPAPQHSRSISHGTGMGASPARGPSGSGINNPSSFSGRDGFNVMDSSNFPSLNQNSTTSRYGIGNMGFAGPGGGSNAYGVGSDGVAGGLSQQTNFTMQNEDFPALPGSGPGAPSSRVGVGGLHQSMPLTSGFRGDEAGGSSSGHGAAVRGNVSAAIVGSSRASNVPRQTAPSSGTQQAGSRAAMGGLGGGATGMQLQQLVNSVEANESSSPANRSKDTKFGLLGLLDVIKMTDRDLNTLALGTDLTTFGLNLSSTDSLYLTFSSPFSDAPAPPEVPYFSTPSCYQMQPPSLKSDHLNKMQIETLFYMFYSMPRDQLQTVAAIELYRREWWYHADLRLWMKMRNNGGETQTPQTNAQFFYFDVGTWEAKVFSGNSLRMSGFLPEEDVAMVLKSQQVSHTVNASTSVPNSSPLNQGSQAVGGATSTDRLGGQAPGSSRSGGMSGQQGKS